MFVDPPLKLGFEFFPRSVLDAVVESATEATIAVNWLCSCCYWNMTFLLLSKVTQSSTVSQYIYFYPPIPTPKHKLKETININIMGKLSLYIRVRWRNERFTIWVYSYPWHHGLQLFDSFRTDIHHLEVLLNLPG